MDSDGPLMEQPSSQRTSSQGIVPKNLPMLLSGVLYQRILASISGPNPGPLMDADGPLMEQPGAPVVDHALGWAKRRFRATHDSFHFKNQQSSLDNHQSIPRLTRGPAPGTVPGIPARLRGIEPLRRWQGGLDSIDWGRTGRRALKSIDRQTKPKNSADAAFYCGFLKTVFPSLIVSNTAMSLMVVDSTFKGFLSRITRSASLPASRVPLDCSSLS